MYENEHTRSQRGGNGKTLRVATGSRHRPQARKGVDRKPRVKVLSGHEKLLHEGKEGRRLIQLFLTEPDEHTDRLVGRLVDYDNFTVIIEVPDIHGDGVIQHCVFKHSISGFNLIPTEYEAQAEA